MASNSSSSGDSNSKDSAGKSGRRTSSDSNSSSNSSNSSSSSSSAHDNEKNGKRRKSKKKKKSGWFRRLMTSPPDEKKLLKAVLWFPLGLAISGVLYYLIIDKMRFQPKTKAVIGAGLGLSLALTFAFSYQMRCVLCLVLPTFVGKAGRSYIAAFAIVYLIQGPITNIINNSKEVVRSLSCTSELLSNHSMEKWRLKLSPVESVVEDITKDGFLLSRVAERIKKAFKPLRDEIQPDREEEKHLEEEIEKAEKLAEKKKKDGKHKTKEKKTKERKTKHQTHGKDLEKKWEKKLDLRCKDVFSKGILRCRKKMKRLEGKCRDALWIVGRLLCWPLKLTVFCQIVKLLPGAVGMDCKSMDVVPPGFGQNFEETDDVIDDMEKGFQVRMQYKVVEEQPDMDYTPVLEMKEKVAREVEKKASILEFVLSVISYILTFTFLLVFKSAYTYNRSSKKFSTFFHFSPYGVSKYLAENKFDNKYITTYFRHIDSRRKARGQKTLLPLKKIEKKDMVFPSTIVLTGGEKKSLIKGTAKLLFRIVISVIIIYMDNLMFQVMEIIARNSRVEYHQEGEHKVDIKVYGRGFMSALVHSVLTKFNTKHTLNKVTTNHACLPSPSKTDVMVVIFIFLTYFMVWLFLYLQAYGLRMRRVIASFFYRKREKKRVLFLYNEMYRKRIGFLRHMRHKVRKALRDNKIKEKVGAVAALQTTFPRLCVCLKVFIKKKPCFVCEEPHHKDFYQCPVTDCGSSYCQQCWRDIKRRCLACGDSSDQDSEFSEMSELTSEEDDEDDNA